MTLYGGCISVLISLLTVQLFNFHLYPGRESTKLYYFMFSRYHIKHERTDSLAMNVVDYLAVAGK